MAQAQDEQRQKLLQQLQCKVKAGTTIFEEGDKSHDLYILLTGALEVRKNDNPIACIDKADTYFGEMSTLLGLPRTATVIAAEDSTLIKIPADKVIEFFNHSPSLALKLSQILALRLHEMNTRQENIAPGRISDNDAVSLYERLVCTPARRKFMRIYTENIGGEMPLADLNPALEVVPAEIGRIITDFEKAGLISTEGNTLRFHESDNEKFKRQLILFAGAQVTS
ncbi:MAG: Crp/Fnr family transcriptional regulator [Planctomycetes bacterium]|nr:Crp/Fnr family transcriptional regulator [Planctomycetota bacterium]